MNNLYVPKSPKMFPEPIQGITDQAIGFGQSGRVKSMGSYWSARLYQPHPHQIIPPGEQVNVIAIYGITLLVIPTGLK
jgi:membrane protein implicated in regulation of membrane protease activity